VVDARQVEPTPKPKRRKKGTKTRLRDECDALFGKLVRGRGPCLACGAWENLQCAHGFSRSYQAVRWDDRNAFPLCRGCHVKFTHRPLEWDEWLRHWWGDETYCEVRALALTHVRPDLNELVAVLRERVKQEVTA
jgi:hypothetical protein